MNNYKIMYLDHGIYRLACDCIDEDHDITFWFDYDPEFEIFELIFFMNFEYSTHYYYKDTSKFNFFKDWYFRIKHALKILFKGHIQIQRDIILSDSRHINNFKEALQKAEEISKEYEYKRKQKGEVK